MDAQTRAQLKVEIFKAQFYDSWIDFHEVDLDRLVIRNKLPCSDATTTTNNQNLPQLRLEDPRQLEAVGVARARLEGRLKIDSALDIVIEPEKTRVTLGVVDDLDVVIGRVSFVNHILVRSGSSTDAGVQQEGRDDEDRYHQNVDCLSSNCFDGNQGQEDKADSKYL